MHVQWVIRVDDHVEASLSKLGKGDTGGKEDGIGVEEMK